MYNKIASIILNTGKANGVSDVFISQPDSLKEGLAGKVFVLAEIGGKKNEGRRVLDFLISNLNDNYYNDEKVLLLGKIEGLKVENIFEAALAKTNKDLTEFLAQQKIRINPAVTNITLGVIYQNKLYFSSFGKNRSLLVYQRGEDYEMINVEANAADSLEIKNAEEAAIAKMPTIFSSVISGEVPNNAYFIFTSEALLEYLSGKEMISIITKLPPIVAAEQIKGLLAKINAYVPFLGIIIKNTIGLANLEIREELADNLSAQSSISSLNYTEQKTEQMLTPAGLISPAKIFKKIRQALKKFKPQANPNVKRVFKPEKEKEAQAPLNLGRVNSLNMARADSFLIKDKIFFKKKTGRPGNVLKKIVLIISALLSPRLWSSFFVNWRQWLKTLNQKNRLLFLILIVIVFIFLISLGITNWNQRRQEAKINFNTLVAQIEDKEGLIDSHLLYNDEEGARIVLGDAQALIDSLPNKKKYQREIYDDLTNRLKTLEEKVQKIIKVEEPEMVNDLTGLGVNNLVWVAGVIYGASGQTIYSLIPNFSASEKWEVSGGNSLDNPQFDGRDQLYYWDNDRVVQFNLKTKNSELININKDSDFVSFKIFNNNLYVLARDKNQIYRYSRSAGGFTTKNDWLTEELDLSQATDLFIDGNIYVLQNNGEVLKLFKGQKQSYSAVPPLPQLTQTNKIIVGTDYIYLLAPDAQRLVVLAKKDGHLINQYQIDSLQQIKDFSIDEKGRAAYILNNENIYKINLE